MPLDEFGLDEEDEAIVQQALATSVGKDKTSRSKKKNQVQKKPGAKVAKKSDSKHTTGSGAASCSTAKAQAEKETNKCTFKHRKTSAAYHQARQRAIQAGMSPSTAKSLGRAASSKVASAIDAGLLKE